MNSAVGVLALLTAAAVTPCRIFDSTSGDADTMASQPISRRASPVAMRVACSPAGAGAICTWLSTAPPFCAAGHVEHGHALAFRWAAMPSRPPMVTTPVPPTPVTSTP